MSSTHGMIRADRRRLARAWPTSAVLAWLGSAAGAAPPQGQPVLITLPPEALATAVGASGFVVGGTCYSGGAFHWMPTSGVTAVGGKQTAAVSRDGRTIVAGSAHERRRACDRRRAVLRPRRRGRDGGSDFCDPFGFCQSWLHQLELSGGVVVRF